MPKVLILNGNSHETWYFGKAGQKYPVSGRSGDYFEVGPQFQKIHKNDALFFYDEDEYKKVMEQRDEMFTALAKKGLELGKIQHELYNASFELLRLKEELSKLQEDNSALLQQIERTVNEQEPVILPWEVVDAIQSFLNDGYDFDHIIKCLLTIPAEDDFPRLKSIRDYASKYGYEFICALANGYIEQSSRERLQEKVEELINQWYDTPETDAGLDADIRQLAAKIVEQAKQII